MGSVDVLSQTHFDASQVLDGRRVHANLAVPALVEHILRRGEAQLSDLGAVCCNTGKFTGRTPGDRFIVRDPTTQDNVAWGKVNQPLTVESYERLLERISKYAQRATELYVQDCYAGADPAYRLSIRVVTELAWHSLFAHQLFIRPEPGELGSFHPDFTVIDLPGATAAPSRDGTHSGTFIVLNFDARTVLIGGTEYAGEIKKSIFSVLNYLLPLRDVFPMHCSANVGSGGDSALFFGLSGTGKTTLSADPARRLIGDDEHGWSEAGVFNFEGGCYAKCIHLSPEKEPQIWKAIRFGAVLENVGIHPQTRTLDFDDQSRTENTRAAYPIDFIDNAVIEGVGPHPRNLFFLSADAFGVLPPIARLSVPHAMYHFLSGYTAKVAGTETGVCEPQATFSVCFGAPFLPLSPLTYARLLGQRLERHNARCWLINTGWVGGGYGVGSRIKLAYTRAMISAALSGALDSVRCAPDPIFGLAVPESVPGVPADVLRPEKAWPRAADYRAAAQALAARFRQNFEQFSGVPQEICAAGPG